MNYDPQGIPREVDFVELAQTADADQTAMILSEVFRDLVGAQTVVTRQDDAAILPKRLATADEATYNSLVTTFLSNLSASVVNLRDILALIIPAE